MRLTQPQQRFIVRLDRLLDEHSTLTGVAQEIADTLQSVVGWDGYRLFAIRPESLEIERLLASSDHDPDLRLGWLQTGYHNPHATPPPPFGFRERLESGVRAVAIHPRLDLSHGMPARIRSGLEPGAYERDLRERYARHFRGMALTGNLHVGFPAGGQIIATLQAHRIGGAKPYSATEVAFLSLIAPRVGEILAAARRQDESRRDDVEPPAEGVSGIVIVRATGEIDYASPAGRMWLDELSEVAIERQTILPESIWAPVAWVRGSQASVTTRIGLSAGSATVEASPGGADGSVALVIAATRSLEVTPIPARWTLTAAEERVAALVVQGNGNREVAGTLSISEHTVEWHLRRIFEKLGIRSRVQLSARYYADAR